MVEKFLSGGTNLRPVQLRQGEVWVKRNCLIVVLDGILDLQFLLQITSQEEFLACVLGGSGNGNLAAGVAGGKICDACCWQALRIFLPAYLKRRPA